MNVYNCRACREIGERPEMRVMRVAVAAENQYHFLLRSKTHTHHSSVHLLQYNSGHKGNDPLCTVSLLLSLLLLSCNCSSRAKTQLGELFLWQGDVFFLSPPSTPAPPVVGSRRRSAPLQQQPHCNITLPRTRLNTVLLGKSPRQIPGNLGRAVGGEGPLATLRAGPPGRAGSCSWVESPPSPRQTGPVFRARVVVPGQFQAG